MPKPPCNVCGSKCCKYIALSIDTPSTRQDYEHIRWYLLHENVRVFIDLENVWFLEFVTRCRSLGNKGKCTTYDTRPQICRTYGSEEDTDECEYFDTPYKICFTSVSEFEAWQESNGRKKRVKKNTGKKKGR